MTYNAQANHFGFDNSDFFRYARDTKLAGKTLTWGIDANNDPTFEDLWNSTPAYGFPWASPDVAVPTGASALIDNQLSGEQGQELSGGRNVRDLCHVFSGYAQHHYTCD